MQAEVLKQAALTTPGFNVYKVMHRYLEAMKIPNIEEVLPNPQGPGAIAPQPNPKVQIEQMKAQEKDKALDVKMKLGIAKLQQEAEVNRAKIMKMEAEAVKAIEEAGGVQKGQEIAMLDAQIGAAKAHQEGILKSIELMTKVNQGENNGTNGTGVPGMEGTPRN